jgi:cell fate (sporulation/competence/biofilm development) regulator YlbF (YheA/YmcA/DUF963 family)
LQKTSWASGGELLELEDVEKSGKAFNQFKDKKSTYNDEMYSTKIDAKKVDKKMEA